MNLLERVLTLLRANLSTISEKTPDPENALRQLQMDMHNQRVQVKTQVATAMAEHHHLKKRLQEQEKEAQKWMNQAEQALLQENESSARSSLAHYNDLWQQASRVQEQVNEQEKLVSRLRSIFEQLEAKIQEVDTSIELLLARKRAATLQQRLYGSTLQQTSGADLDLQKAQQSIRNEENQAQLLAHLHNAHPDQQQHQMNQLSKQQLVEQQLSALKARRTQANKTKTRRSAHELNTFEQNGFDTDGNPSI